MMNTISTSSSWSIGKRIAFRFCFLYFALYFFPAPLNFLPFVVQFDAIVSAVWTPAIVWVGKTVLKLEEEITVLPNGSGDTTWNYVQVLIVLTISTVGTILWTILDRKRHNYDRLFYWMIVGLRYCTGIVLINYGFAKIIPIQFLLPLDSYGITYAESSAMGLLWRFMSYSSAYNFFTGGFEALGGLLLLFRRTKLLGGLISLTLLSNIVMLNFTYDVPVKLWSIHLFIMTVIVLLPDASRILNFLVYNRPTDSVLITPVFKNKTIALIVGVCKAIFIVGIIGIDISAGLSASRMFEETAGASPFAGNYEIQEHIVNHDTLPPLLNDPRRWHMINVKWNEFSKSEKAGVQYMDMATVLWDIRSDTLRHRINIFAGDSSTGYKFKYKTIGDVYYLKGTLLNDSIHMSMKRVGKDIPLMSRGFHWINETPYYK
ncbi:MAG TPA: hypothetical protein VK666_30005 [Chryseolinea sp.]|nr:hypothetical protein [Chryseolinea sp.]